MIDKLRIVNSETDIPTECMKCGVYLTATTIADWREFACKPLAEGLGLCRDCKIWNAKKETTMRPGIYQCVNCNSYKRLMGEKNIQHTCQKCNWLSNFVRLGFFSTLWALIRGV